MSSLLEQAIIDANQLREAALKSAESTVTEKYSEEIKSIMSELLAEAEGDLDLLGDEELEAEPSPEAGPEQAPTSAGVEIPPAALDGETACPCPDDVEGDGEEVEYELDLDQLAYSPDASAARPVPVEKVAGQIAGTLEENNTVDDSADLEEDATPTEIEEENEKEIDEEISLDLDEEIEFSPEDLMGLLEELEVSVDAGGVPTGWLGTPESTKADQIHQNLATLKDTEEGEEKEELMKKLKELEESNTRNADEAQEFKNLAENLAEKLNRVNTYNAKLLYINKTLSSTSLNERQRKSIVEAITKANTAEEAKVIFETLQSTVGNSSHREPLPESLSEAVNRKKPAMLVSHPRRASQTDERLGSFADRMRKLAGIT